MNAATVSNTNLFAVAANTLGDATQWVRIAQLNGLADSIVAGTVTLALPPVDPTATGGIVTIDDLSAYPVLAINLFPPPGGGAASPGPRDAVWDGFDWDDGSVWV